LLSHSNITWAQKRIRYRLAMGGIFWGSNTGGGMFFSTRSDRFLGPHSLLYSGCPVSFPKVERLGCGFDHPLPSTAEVKERVELYLCPPSGAFMSSGKLKFSFHLAFYSNVTRATCHQIHLWYLVSFAGKLNRNRFENHARTLTTFYGRHAGIVMLQL
jgi:hypothetical protein